MKKYILLLFLLFLSTLSGLRAASSDGLFEQANKAYQRLQFDSAAKYYEQIESQGLASADLHYNLGNCYYKLKQVAPAILHYEKALKINPADEDARANLALANLLVVDKITPVPTLFYQQWLNGFSKQFPSDKLARFSIYCAWFILLSIVLFLLTGSGTWKKTFFFSGLLASILLILSLTLAFKNEQQESSEGAAILFSSSAYIKSSPDVKSQDLFILHEGVKMQLLDQIGDWCRIRIANGNEGWIEKDEIRVI